MTLIDAIAALKQRPGAPSNAYDWYRRSAQRYGEVWIGETRIKSWKEGRAWWVDDAEVADALARHDASRARLVKATNDLKNGIAHGAYGQSTRTLDGGYSIHGDFRYQWSDLKRAQGISDGSWICNKCNLPAQMKRDKEECRVCRDWNGCGRDCRLSGVSCKQCGSNLAF